MDLVHRLHYLVLSQKGDLFAQDREQKLSKVKRQTSLPEQHSKSSRSFHRMRWDGYHNDKELFGARAEGAAAERKLSAASTGSMKNKWLKAFRSLKPAPSSSPPSHNMQHDRRNGSGVSRDPTRGLTDPDAHNFQEYTYKKITPCDVCSQVLRGHTRQGLRCRLCKMNVHADCMPSVGKCQTKSRLLRRQKSTSEIESRIPDVAFEEEKDGPEVDQIYQVLKQASEISRPGAGSAGGAGGDGKQTCTVRVSGVDEPATALRRPPPPRAMPASLAVTPQPIASSSAPHSPRRQKLNLRMKSLSLDSPECTDHRRRPQVARELPISGHSSSSRIHSPSSPVHNRRLLVARPGRVNSVDLPDDHDKSLSSASASPCPSPVKQFCIQQKQQRLLPTNLFVVLYNFKSRQPDELDLKAGYKVTVIDTSDDNWWKGKCMGKIGYFPSKYCTKLQAGEKPLQVTSNLQIPDGETSLKLLRDQIVIQVGDEVQGMVMIRSGDNRQAACPIKYLQEV